MSAAPDRVQLALWLDQGRPLLVEPSLAMLCASADIDDQLLAARALRHLGAERAGDALTLRVGRQHPGHAAAQIALLRTVLGNRGAYAYWRVAARYPLPTDASAAERAERLSLDGAWLAELRDGGAAREAQQAALALVPDDPWLWVEHSHALSRLDQHEQALAAAQEALRLQPGYRSAVHQVASLLWQLLRRDEARSLLEATFADTANGNLAWQLHDMAADEGRHAQALTLLEAVEHGLPRMEKRARGLLAARRADALLHLGRFDEAQAAAASVPGVGFYSALAERLRDQAPASRRVLLPLAMVRQHWMTCAPATLTALARFWGQEAEHLEVAQAICYDGTPQASERIWAAQQGFATFEFKLDWPTARALLDAGLPFALATRHVGGGHLQAVVGYDHLRRTLLIRDPSFALHAEYEAVRLFDEQQACGPRALLLLPPAELPRLTGIVLPQADEWDLAHAVHAALLKHDREAAVAAVARLEACAPRGENTLHAERTLALYDGDETRILAATEALLALYPDDRNLQLSQLTSLFHVRGQLAGERALESLVARADVDTYLLCRWSARLSRDARRLPAAFAVARRALRRDPLSGAAWSEYAERQWQTEGAAYALPALRWASTLQATDEWTAATFARACRVAGDAERGLAWLRERVQTWGDRASAPAITLAEALDAEQRNGEADQVLDAALVRRPEDGALALHLAERRLHQHRHADAERLLAAATTASEPARLRVRALLKEAQGAIEAALADVTEAVTREPLNLDHHRQLLRLLRRQFGESEALRRWRPLADARPAHLGLQRLLYDALPDQAELVNAQLARLHAQHPGDAWLQRERALQASRQGRHDEAVALATAAAELAPDMAVSHDVLAACHRQRGGYAAALVHLHAAVRRDAEYESAVTRLIDAPDAAGVQAGIAFVADELRRQVLLGDGLLTFQSEAARGWAADDIEALLRELHARWPQLWQGPVALSRQLMVRGEVNEACAVLEAACARFPALPRAQLELAEVLRHQGRLDAAQAACRRALDLSPAWNPAVRMLVDMLGEHGPHWEQAEAVLERALRTQYGWDDADLIGLLAWVHEKQARADDALAAARRSLLLDPQPGWIWAVARRVCEARERLQDVDALIDEVVSSRPGDAAAWLVRATQGRDGSAALQAAEKAVELAPRLASAWSARFTCLQRLGRSAEVLDLLPTLPWPAPAPLELRGWHARALWDLGRHEQALSAIAALREEAPTDVGLCVLHADWLDERNDHAGYLAAAEALQQLVPLEARAHLYVGHALVKSERWQESLAPLLHALRLQPSYRFAAAQLVLAASRANVPEVAEPVLQALWQHYPDVDCACDGLELAVQARIPEIAQRWLERLFTLEEFDTERSLRALAEWRAAGWQQQLDAQQAAHVARGGGPAGVALDWLQQRARYSFWYAFLSAVRLQRSARGPHLLRALLLWLTQTESSLCLAWLVRRFEPALRDDALAWGEVSYALSTLNAHRAVVRWLADWRTRERPPLFAMANLAGSQAVLGQWPALAEVVEATLARAPYQEDMRLWQMLLQARANDLEALADSLARCHEWQPDPWMEQPLAALRAFLALARARAAGGTIRALRRLHAHGVAPQARVLHVALQRLALRRHTPWTQVWRWYLP